MWNYKGFEIAIIGQRFRAEIYGKFVTGASLVTLKKSIDKHLDDQAALEGCGHQIEVAYDTITGTTWINCGWLTGNA